MPELTPPAQAPRARTVKAPSRFPKVAAVACACCGQELTTGEGYDVPVIGPVGPKCVLKFATLADALLWVDGRHVKPDTTDQALLRAGHNVVVRLRGLGIEINRGEDGILRVGRMPRNIKAVAKSYKKMREAFARDLQVASDGLGALPAPAPDPLEVAAEEAEATYTAAATARAQAWLGYLDAHYGGQDTDEAWDIYMRAHSRFLVARGAWHGALDTWQLGAAA
ncbi:hypothetical protein K7W42_19155 [Deinococcus sp. HMF7604]|uniref:hypothetical protein n=1 Tax=Deinococcus betulae TaxID=2873312 RepID=UPI001CCA224F|nr:hypothetical protein [Deinococcus betulae]MBZ9752960.1 hypothetical protein [Deinococcus betulae]